MRTLKPQSELTRVLLAAVDTVQWGQWPVLAAVGRPKDQHRYFLWLHESLASPEVTDAQIEHILMHEAAHLVGGHLVRGQNSAGADTTGDPAERGAKQMAWAIATDCVVHHQPGYDEVLATADRLMQRAFHPEAKGVSFERVDLPAMPAEIAYEELLKRHREQNGQGQGSGQGCGRHEFLEAQGASDELRPDHAFELGQAFDRATGSRGADKSHSHGRSLIGDIPPPPGWVSQVLDRLTDWSGRVRKRSWRREHRHLPDVLPGRAYMREYPAAVFMIDASGSMSDEQLRQILGAVAGTPELAHSTVRVFSDWCGEPLPVSDPGGIKAEAARHGGGTLICKAAEVVDEATCVVWLTDACSADGLPPPRPDWTWVVWGYGNSEPRVLDAPREG